MLTVRPIPESEIAMHESALDEFARTLEVNTGIELGPPKKTVVLAFEDDVIVGCLWSTAEPPFDLDVGVDKQFRAIVADVADYASRDGYGSEPDALQRVVVSSELCWSSEAAQMLRRTVLVEGVS
jgi:hypothetical protein